MISEIELDHDETPMRFEIDWTPARPAPACSDPDSPSFSDPGDPGEVVIRRAWIVAGTNYFPGAEQSPAEVVLLNEDGDLLERLYAAAEKQEREAVNDD